MQNFKRLKYWMPLACSVMFVAGLWLGVYLKSTTRDSEGERKLREMLDLIRENYVDEVDMDSLIEKSLPSILANLDPHSAYISGADLEAANEELQGSFTGLGIQFELYRDTINIVEVIADGPAEKAGLLPGDRIVSVGSHKITGSKITADTVRTYLRGPDGSKVIVGIVRPSAGKGVKKYTLTRRPIPFRSVDTYYMIDGKTGYVKVDNFGEQTYRQFLHALNVLRDKGADSYIVDLRGNTGGYMETAVFMANEFLPAGLSIVGTRGRDMNEEIVRSDGNGAYQNARVAVLMDEFSASSSEIFAGALQDHDRALVIGRRSFGKGLVQHPFHFEDGSELRLTVQRYYTPSGRCIQKDYKPGQNEDYELEILERFHNGEAMSADSVKINKSLLFRTDSGRPVYGGGGIVPDIFVPNDTAGVTGYYRDVVNKGLLKDFAYEYSDLNRGYLQDVRDFSSLQSHLPSDDVLLQSFVYYATTRGVPARFYYIKQSRKLIVTTLKALIARYVLGFPAYYRTFNASDPTVLKAVSEIAAGNADIPIRAVMPSKAAESAGKK